MFRIVFAGSVALVAGFSMSLLADESLPLDARLKIARVARDIIAEAEASEARTEQEIVADIEAAFAKIEASLPQLKSEGLERSAVTISAFRAAAHELHQLAKQLLARRDEYAGNRKALNSAQAAAIPAYRSVAAAFRQWAKEATYTDLKADYIRVAEIWEKLAKEIEVSSANFEPNEEKLAEALAYLEETALFVGRFADALDSAPDMGSLSTQESYLNALKRYIRMYETFRGLIEDFHRELTAKAVNTALRPAPEPSTPQLKNPPVHVASYGRSPQAAVNATPARPAYRTQLTPESQRILSQSPPTPRPRNAAAYAPQLPPGGNWGPYSYRYYYGVP